MTDPRIHRFQMQRGMKLLTKRAHCFFYHTDHRMIGTDLVITVQCYKTQINGIKQLAGLSRAHPNKLIDAHLLSPLHQIRDVC